MAVQHNEAEWLINLDDCPWLDILQYLSVRDLTTVAFTCRRMRHLAQIAFHSKPIHGKNAGSVLLKCFGNKRRKPFERFFAYFGQWIRELTLDVEDRKLLPLMDWLFRLTTRFCTSGRLQVLRLTKVNINVARMKNAAEVLSTLKVLHLNNCTGDLKRLVNALVKLKYSRLQPNEAGRSEGILYIRPEIDTSKSTAFNLIGEDCDVYYL